MLGGSIRNQIDYEFKASGAANTANAMRNLGQGAAYAGAAIAAATAALYATAGAMAKAGAEIYDTAQQLNISAESAQALGYVADQTGSSLGGLTGSIRALNTAFTAAESANSTQARALRSLGLDYAELRRMAPEQAFLAITDAIGGVSDEMEQNLVASQIFGNRYATQVVGALNQTDGSLRTLMDSFNESGRAMSGEQITALKKYDDAMTDVEYSIKALTADAIVPLLPKMQEITDKLVTLATDNMPTFIASAEALATALLFVAEAAMKVANNFVAIGEHIGGGLANAWNWVSGASRDLAIAEQMADEAAQRVLELQMAGQLSGAGATVGMRLLAQATAEVTEAAIEAGAALGGIGGGDAGGTVSGGGATRRDPGKEIQTAKQLLEMDRARFNLNQQRVLAEHEAWSKELQRLDVVMAREQQAYMERMQPLISMTQRSTDIIVGGFTSGFDSVLDGFQSMLTRMAAEWLKSQIARTILGIGGKATGGFFL